MKPNVIVSLVIGLLLLGGLVWWFTRSTVPTDTTNQTTNESVNITTNTTTSNVNEDRSFNTGNSNTTVNTNTTVPLTLTMTITADGVSPNSPTIARGTIVTFRNNNTIEHQIASDPHPDHTDLNGFDLEIPAGQSRTFTFSRSGSWGYHDHEQDLNTKYQGVITVE